MSQLRKGALTLAGAIVATCAFMGPATSVYFNSSIGIQNAGNAIGFAFLLAMCAVLVIAYTISQFARKLPTAGFAYTFAVRGIGPKAGFLTGWLLLLGYAVVSPLLLAAIGYFLSQFFSSYFHINITWGVFSVLVAGLILLLASKDVKTSIRVASVMLVIELGVMLALFLTILFRGGVEGLSFATFSPAHSLKPYDWNGIGTAVMWSILMFVGFESAATLGEETKDPHRNIPRTLYFVVMAIGVFFLLAAFSAVSGYGPSNAMKVVDNINKGGNPWDTISTTFWGSKASIIIMLVILNSIFANLLSGFNATVRILYTMGRENVIFRFLGEVSETRHVPVKASVAYMIASLIFTLILGYAWGPMTLYGWTGTILGVAIVIVYLIISLSLISFYKKSHPSEFRIFKHVIMPLLAVALLYLPLKGVIMSTLPAGGGAGPMTYIPYVVGGWILFGVIYMFYLNYYKSDSFAGIGKAFEE